ncbi:hypothetical protein [Microbulbifer sp. VAAF005]|uniref:hypothetical protein n=1 Tax=Microbulbifer sp. VAAF005 TaxID=3034230 RepID=UPI0024AD5EE6|nr:hypothetical protein [Microbulbifer sp. VAAF005]WHI46717.1 hypothetical protein P0078_23960 [Microbulbifer sp. VAAF005]
MNKHKLTVIALFIVLTASFTVLLSLGSDIYREKPPIPVAYVDSGGQIVFSREDIERGQLVWRSMGGHQLGSVWGHGSYVAPDWTADWLHKEAQAWLDITAQRRYGENFSDLSPEIQAGLELRLRKDMRQNTANISATGETSVSLSTTRIQAIEKVSQHYISLFGSDPEKTALREQYAMKEDTVPLLERRKQLSAFFSGEHGRPLLRDLGRNIHILIIGLLTGNLVIHRHLAILFGQYLVLLPY